MPSIFDANRLFMGAKGLIFALGVFICCAVSTADAQKRVNMDIHTVLPYDQIPAIFNPEFVSADSADIHPDSPVIGVAIGDEARAYSMILLNHHEIVNDEVGGEAIATTW